MDNDERLKRADNAARILKDPLWDESWNLLLERLADMTMAAKTDEGTLRGKLTYGLAIDLRRIWEGYVKDGEYTRDQIKLDKQKWYQRAA